MEVRGWLYARWYTARPTPRIRLSGVNADPARLFDGSMIQATARWWNDLLARRPALQMNDGFRRLDDAETRELAAAINPENRDLLSALGSQNALMAPRLGAAAISLSYALARTLWAGNPQWDSPLAEMLFLRLEPVEVETLETYSKRYTLVADYYGWEESPGWWAEQEAEWVSYRIAIQAMRWAYSDQVKRWERAEGREVGKAIDPATFAESGGSFVTDYRARLFELGGRFLEAELELVTIT